jgi:hypothetical protein
VVKIPVYLHGTYDQDPESLEQYMVDYLGAKLDDFWVDDLVKDIIDATYEVALNYNTDTGKLEMAR